MVYHFLHVFSSSLLWIQKVIDYQKIPTMEVMNEIREGLKKKRLKSEAAIHLTPPPT